MSDPIREAAERLLAWWDAEEIGTKLGGAPESLFALRWLLASPAPSLPEPVGWISERGLLALSRGGNWDVFPTGDGNVSQPLYTTPMTQGAYEGEIERRVQAALKARGARELPPRYDVVCRSSRSDEHGGWKYVPVWSEEDMRAFAGLAPEESAK